MIMSSLCCFILHFLGRNSTNIDWINNKGGCKMPVYGLWHGIMGRRFPDGGSMRDTESESLNNWKM